jgi:hypothetical protein
MSQLGIPGVVPSGVGAMMPLYGPHGSYLIEDVNGLSLNGYPGVGRIQLQGQQQNMTEQAPGAVTPTLGTTAPATVTTPYKWVKVLSADGTQCFMPIWK